MRKFPDLQYIYIYMYVAAFTTGEVVKLKPTKVVAGHDAERTNEFLQVLSISILKQVRPLIDKINEIP